MSIKLKSRGFWAHENPEAQKNLNMVNEIMKPEFEELAKELRSREMNLLIYGTTHPELINDPTFDDLKASKK